MRRLITSFIVLGGLVPLAQAQFQPLVSRPPSVPDVGSTAALAGIAFLALGWFSRRNKRGD